MSRTRLHPAQRRAEILAAARAAFARADYATVSIAEIAAQAGVTPGLVNHYFGVKRDLYLAVLREVAAGLPELIRTDLRHLPRAEMIERNTSAFLDVVDRNRDVWPLLLGAQGVRDPEVGRIVSAARRAVVERMAHNHSDHPSDELRLALRVYQGAAEAATGEWLRGRASRGQVHRVLCRLLLAATEPDADG